MARPHTWLPRLPEIIKAVEISARTHYDRSDIERLFDIQRRAAQKVQNILPCVKIGASRLVEREALLNFLQSLRETGNATQLVAKFRQEKVKDSKRVPRTLIRKDVAIVHLDSLPDNIDLSRGRLQVTFRSTEHMVESLYQLALILEAQGEEFAARFDPTLAESQEPAYSAEMEDSRYIQAEIDRMEAEWMASRLVV
jgi:hypothetical protein